MIKQAENNKRIAKNTILLYFRMFIVMFISFYTSRVVLNSLGVTDYGVYNVVGGIVSSLTAITTSMAISTQRWITIGLGKNDFSELKKIFSVAFTTQFIISILVLFLLETIGIIYLYNYAVIPQERFDAAFIVFQLSTMSAIITINNVPFQGAILAHERMGIYALFSIIDVIIKLIICFILPNSNADKLILYSILLFISIVVNFIFIILYCYRKFPEVNIRFSINKSIMRSMWSLAFWNMLGKIVFISYSQGLTLLMNFFFGPTINAASSISSQATNMLNQFGTNFQVAVNPQITKNYATGNLIEMHKLIFRSTKFSFFLMLFIAVPLFFESDILLKFWLGKVPEHTLLFTKLAIFWTLIASIYNPLNTAAIANGNIKRFQIWVYGIQAFILPVTYVAYKNSFIPETSSIVFIFFYFISTLIAVWQLKYLINLSFISYIKEVLMPIISVSLLSFISIYFVYINFDEGFVRLIIISIASTIIISLYVYNIGLKDNEKSFIKDKLLTKLYSRK